MGALKAHIKKLAATVTAASFLLSLSTSAPAAPAHCELVAVRAFHIEAKVDRPVYLVGEKPVIHTTVTRPAREDPAGYGVELDPPREEPAPDINVGAGIRVRDSWLFGFGVSNEKGKTDLEVDLQPDMNAGMADVDIYAWRDTVQTPCLTIREYGYRKYEDMFRVVKP